MIRFNIQKGITSKKQKYGTHLIISGTITIVLAIVFLNILLDCTVHSDDAGGVFYAWMLQQGICRFSPVNIGISNLVSLISYLLFGVSLKTCYVTTVVMVTVVLFLSLLISSAQIRSSYQWIGVFFVWFFLFIPYNSAGTEPLKSHNNVLFCMLALLIFTEWIYIKESKIKYVLIAGVLLYVYMPIDALAYVQCVVPFLCIMLLKYKEFKSKGECAKREVLLLIICILGSIIGSGINWIDRGGTSGGLYSGGGIMFANSSDAVLRNFKGYVDSLTSLFNINFYNQKVLSLTTIYYGIKILLVLAVVYIMFNELKKVFLGGKYDMIIVFLSISFVCVSSAYILGNVFIDLESRRYLNSFAYTFPIILCRKFCSADMQWMCVRKARYGIIVSMIVLMLLEVRLFPKMDFTILTREQDALHEFLVEHDLECGYAEFWTAGRTSLAAGLDVRLVPASAGILSGEAGWEPYKYWLEDEQAYFNFIVTKKWETMPVKYGVPLKRYEVLDYCIYVYDYDIRLVSENL